MHSDNSKDHQLIFRSLFMMSRSDVTPISGWETLSLNVGEDELHKNIRRISSLCLDALEGHPFCSNVHGAGECDECPEGGITELIINI